MVTGSPVKEPVTPPTGFAGATVGAAVLGLALGAGAAVSIAINVVF